MFVKKKLRFIKAIKIFISVNENRSIFEWSEIKTQSIMTYLAIALGVFLIAIGVAFINEARNLES